MKRAMKFVNDGGELPISLYDPREERGWIELPPWCVVITEEYDS